MSGRKIYDFALHHVEEKWGVKIYSALAYGSRIGGYASEHSDYDLIVIGEEFKEGIRYIYEKLDKNYISILLVDKELFEEDVYEARHGEFVSGRLYTVYLPLINGEYIRKMEIELKKRTILEELCILFYSFKELTYEFLIPTKYFLYSRLRRRIQMYPPVKYSYYNMFFGEKGSENLEFSLNGFRIALRDLEGEGMVKYVDDDRVKVLREPWRCRAIVPLLFRFFKRGVKSYLTHTRSAKVKPSVVLEETMSKIRRSIESITIPTELSNPETLLAFEDVFFNNEYRDVENTIKYMFGPEARIEEIMRKGLFSELYIVHIDVNGEKHILTHKKFSIFYNVKWFMIQLWLLDIKKFILFSRKRLVNEFIMMNHFHKTMKINVPKPILLSWPDSSLYMEYIGGKRLIDMDILRERNEILRIYRELGSTLAILHSNKTVLGDVKPNNIVVGDEGWYIVDLEQAGEKNDYSWDIAELIFYSFIWSSPLKKIDLKDICNSFIQGYMENGDSKWLKKAVTIKYIRPFIPLVPLNTLIKIRRCIKNLLQS